MSHTALTPGAVALITGGASGIGLAAAKKFASLGLRVCIADLGNEKLTQAQGEVSAIAPGAEVMIAETDISRVEELQRLERDINARFGGVDVLMNNAGIQRKSSTLTDIKSWQQTFDVNWWGAVHGVQVFAPAMMARKRPGLIINTGSKQGITMPPGNPAYNVSKAALKAFTEALQHELRNTPGCQISAHLLIPGYVFTPLVSGGSTEKPAGAWTPEQTIGFMIERLEANDFYILCPDNDVPRALDERRILWAAGDIVENRPPLSRWHPDYSAAFTEFAKKKA